MHRLATALRAGRAGGTLVTASGTILAYLAVLLIPGLRFVHGLA